MKVKTVMGSSRDMLEHNTNLTINRIVKAGGNIKEFKFSVAQTTKFGSPTDELWALLIIYEIDKDVLIF